MLLATNILEGRRPEMVSKNDVEKRNRLAYLALYCAIQGDEERSEQIRNLVLQRDREVTLSSVLREPATV